VLTPILHYLSLRYPVHLAFTRLYSNELVKANGWDMDTAINLYLEGNFGNSGNIAPPKAAGGGDTIASPPLGNAGVVNEQGGGGHIDPRTLIDEEMARYLVMSFFFLLLYSAPSITLTLSIY
jgi:hypothetical protein